MQVDLLRSLVERRCLILPRSYDRGWRPSRHRRHRRPGMRITPCNMGFGVVCTVCIWYLYNTRIPPVLFRAGTVVQSECSRVCPLSALTSRSSYRNRNSNQSVDLINQYGVPSYILYSTHRRLDSAVGKSGLMAHLRNNPSTYSSLSNPAWFSASRGAL